jgi:hypothetical protein
VPGNRPLRNQVYICDLGYTEGVTPLRPPPPTTPDCEPHTPHPAAYVAHSDWADQMMQTHNQRQCRGCGLWLIWEPKENDSALAGDGNGRKKGD